jgi:hypothetical protein
LSVSSFTKSPCAVVFSIISNVACVSIAQFKHVRVQASSDTPTLGTEVISMQTLASEVISMQNMWRHFAGPNPNLGSTVTGSATN